MIWFAQNIFREYPLITNLVMLGAIIALIFWGTPLAFLIAGITTLVLIFCWVAVAATSGM